MSRLFFSARVSGFFHAHLSGEPYRIDSVSYEFRDKFLEQIIIPDTANTLLRKGGIFDITVLDRERERIAAYLKERDPPHLHRGIVADLSRLFPI